MPGIGLPSPPNDWLQLEAESVGDLIIKKGVYIARINCEFDRLTLLDLGHHAWNTVDVEHLTCFSCAEPDQ
jgi:hypothetical protein